MSSGGLRLRRATHIYGAALIPTKPVSYHHNPKGNARVAAGEGG